MKFQKGDIVLVSFNPRRGHEQGDYRPALVVNKYPLPGDINLVMPITSHIKSFPFEVELDNRTNTRGCVLCFQVRALDLGQRAAKYIEKAPGDLTDMCCEYLEKLLG